MYARLTAAVLLAGMLALSAGPAPASTAPKPAPTPKTIKHVYSVRLCTGLKRSVLPAIARILQNDHAIATSRPLFDDYVKNVSTASQGATDMDVMRLERLIDPLVKNTQEIEKLLNDTVYPRNPQNENDKQLLAIRAHLMQVLAQQKQALDLVSGFVDTQNMGELQAAGHEYDSAINGSGDATKKGPNDDTGYKPQLAPTAPPQTILNAGVQGSGQGDPARQYDPRYTNTGSTLGYNPLHVFGQQMEVYQQQIFTSENNASQAIFKAVPTCGGKVPGQPVPPSPMPAPGSPAPAALPSPAPSGKP